MDDYEEEPVLKPGCKEYFWLLCKLVDNIHIKDASQVCLKLHINLLIDKLGM
jgi:ubiquitin carboxyl-terminal hydrolase 34